MSASTNAERAGCADVALKAFIARTGTDCEGSLADLLADLMHWADKCGISFDGELYSARYHYEVELTKGGAMSARRPTLPDEIAVSWHILDVAEVRPDLTASQCRKVLDRVKRCHDATIGICWDVLSYHANDLYPPKN